MRHSSVPVGSPIELIEMAPTDQSPLISKCQIKVCYVGETPNRNRSVITKQTAREMAKSLPGSVIVGYYNEQKKDFEEHSRELEITESQVRFKDITRPYGFVDLHPRCWFQTFRDDDEVEREYLVTEGYLWTGQYPEANRIIEQGNNQSMELDENTLNASWAKNDKDGISFFIINEAIISKLCILGEDVEPCFEGASIVKAEYSLGDDFKEQVYSMIHSMQQILEKGGTQPMNNENENQVLTPDVEESSDTSVIEANTIEEFALEENSAEEEQKNYKAEDKKDEKDDKNSEDNSEGEKSSDEESSDEEDDEEDKKKKYNLDEVTEYSELTARFAELETNYNNLLNDKAALEAEINDLRAFKLSVERAKKEDMIKSFYMLSDEDKKDVVDNIDTYSLDDIEAKLSILCVRNRVNFAALDEDNSTNDTTTFNIDSTEADESIPAWIKLALETENSLH